MRQSQAAKRDLSCNPETLELSLHSVVLLGGKRERKKDSKPNKKIEAGKEKHHNSSEFKENVSKGY